MSTNILPSFLLAVFSLCQADSRYDVSLSQVYFDGGMVFFPVKRETLQKRLDVINSQSELELFLPREPVMQHVIGCDEHIIFVVFGEVLAITSGKVLTEEQKESLVFDFTGITITVPYLSFSEEGQAEVSLQMSVFDNVSRPVIFPDVVFPPPITANRLIRTNNGSNIQLIFEKDDLRLHLTGERAEDCRSTGDQGEQGINEYEQELQVSRLGPDFSVCDRSPDLDVDICRIYRDPCYRDPLSRAGSNVCQYWESTNNKEICNVSFRTIHMSDEMRELLLLESATQNPVEAELQTGIFGINLVFPCF